jgi:hypothetical protein
MMFDSCSAGGFCGFVQIKLFALPNCGDYEECCEQILEHEVLHQTLGKMIGVDAKRELDHIHRSFFALDCNTNQWTYVLRFAHEKKGKITIIL